MRQIATAVCLLLLPLQAAADWTRLDGAGITAALTDRVLDYGAATQDFRPSGRTLYNAGRDSWGYWDVRDNRYCSQWPPADGWACYDVDLHSDGRLRFVGDAGDETVGAYVD